MQQRVSILAALYCCLYFQIQSTSEHTIGRPNVPLSLSSTPSIMFRSSSLLQLLSCLVAVGDAAISYNPMLTCQDQEIARAPVQVCASYSQFSASPAVLPNGTTLYLGPTGYQFTYWQGLEAGADTSDPDVVSSSSSDPSVSMMEAGVQVQWESGSCQVKVGDTDCNSCLICEEFESDATLSADCTNVRNGRTVGCEPAFIFYPFAQDAQVQDDSAAATTWALTTASVGVGMAVLVAVMAL